MRDFEEVTYKIENCFSGLGQLKILSVIENLSSESDNLSGLNSDPCGSSSRGTSKDITTLEVTSDVDNSIAREPDRIVPIQHTFKNEKQNFNERITRQQQ